MENTINLEAYLKRIGYIGKPVANLETLQTIQRLHPDAIPFENLNPFTATPVKIDLESIQQKLVQDGRGGYCFEQNHLLKAVLEQIGFEVKGLAARVVWGRTKNDPAPFSHMLLLVTLENIQYIVDVGFGSMSLTGPLVLEVDKVQTTPHEDFRIVQDGTYYRVDGWIKSEWHACYKFHLEEHFMADYEMMNWYTSCHPQSHFTYTITAARAFDQGRYTLRDNVFHAHYLDQPSEKTIITETTEFQAILQHIFGLNLSKLPNLEERLNTLIK